MCSAVLLLLLGDYVSRFLSVGLWLGGVPCIDIISLYYILKASVRRRLNALFILCVVCVRPSQSLHLVVSHFMRWIYLFPLITIIIFSELYAHLMVVVCALAALHTRPRCNPTTHNNSNGFFADVASLFTVVNTVCHRHLVLLAHSSLRISDDNQTDQSNISWN